MASATAPLGHFWKAQRVSFNKIIGFYRLAGLEEFACSRRAAPRKGERFRAVRPDSGFLMIPDLVHLNLRTERIVFVGDIGSVVRSMQDLVLLALFSLRRFFALLILASQLFLPFLKRCA